MGAPDSPEDPPPEGAAAFRDALRRRVLVFDGAMGTMLQAERLSEEDFRGEALREHPAALQGLHDALCLTQPALVRRVHDRYLEAGADALTTNTFNANAVSLADYRLEAMAGEISRRGAAIAREAADRARRADGRPRFVLGSMGPTNRTLGISPNVSDPAYRAISWEELRAAYLTQARGLLDGGADVLLVETCFDTLNAKAALDACREAIGEAAPDHDRGASEAGLVVSFTAVDASGRNLGGQDAEAFWIAVAHARPDVVGVNCSLGAAAMRPFLETLALRAPVPVACVPNAGLPNDLGGYDEPPETTARLLGSFAADGLVNAVGGCCGTTPDHAAAIAEAVRGAPPREPPSPSTRLRLSGTDPLVAWAGGGFLEIGERTNVTGSRRFARRIREERFEEAVDVARDQVRGGANVLDVNMDDALLDSEAAMTRFLRLLAMEPEAARLPIMVDSSRFEVIEAGLRCLPGKGVVNSLSLKDGPDLFLERARRVRRLGAALVVMAFDEEGQAVDRERKTAICSRAFDLLTGEAGFPPEDVVFDPNVLAVATGIPEHDRYAVEFIESIPKIKRACPGALVSGGVSNLSFAFRGNETVRGAMNAVFLRHAIAAGLDMAILNAGRLPAYDDIPADLRERVEDVVLARRADASERLLAFASEARRTSGAARAGRGRPDDSWRREPPGERLRHALVNGVLDHVEADAEESRLELGSALAVIEGPLMDGMRVVGDRFGDGRMFLPQVVKSARVMKRAVSVLEPYIERSDGTGDARQTVVLATVKGDVHDIGKSIVGIVLACNGYAIEDLGVMAPSERILAAARETGASLVGLSGLITPSLDEMERVAADMEREGLELPLLIGGATTSARHTALRIAPRRSGAVIHAADAARASEAARALLGSDRRRFEADRRAEQEAMRAEGARPATARLLGLEEARARKPAFAPAPEVSSPVTSPPEPGVRKFPDVPIADLIPYVDWTPFFHVWELRGTYPAILGREDVGEAARELHGNAVRRLDGIAAGGLLRASAVFGLFRAASDGDDILVHPENDSGNAAPARLPMLRQQEDRPGPRLSCADFLAPADGAPDTLGAFCVTAGHGLDELVRAAESNGDDYDAVMVRALADRLAEAAAEWLHQEARRDFGYGGDERLAPADLLRGAYRGIRPAPGYPATPDLGVLADILPLVGAAEATGVSLTEGCAIRPAASVAGLYFFHPEARYFSVGRIGKDQLADYARRRGVTQPEAARLLRRHL